jgi:hypothetical protein
VSERTHLATTTTVITVKSVTVLNAASETRAIWNRIVPQATRNPDEFSDGDNEHSFGGDYAPVVCTSPPSATQNPQAIPGTVVIISSQT